MSAVRTTEHCPRMRVTMTRYRNRKAARNGLIRTRQAARAAGADPGTWPGGITRCSHRDRGGCGGWHLTANRQARRELHARLTPAPLRAA